MQNHIVLVSDDFEFFEYIIPKLSLRKSDEVYRFCFDEIPEKLHLLKNTLLIVNAEDKQEETIALLDIVSKIPTIVFSFQENEDFKIRAYRAGMLGYISLMTSQEEFEAIILSALNYTGFIEKSDFYREILSNKNLISKNNEVYSDYTSVLDSEIKKISENAIEAVLMAISPNEKTKFLLQPNQIETIILKNIRKNDILMNYATNKYFLLLHNTNVTFANHVWEKIQNLIPEKIYAGIASIGNKSRQQIINEVLNRLHEAINKDLLPETNTNSSSSFSNYKLYRREFNKNFEKTVTPVFYQIQQKYNGKLFGIKIQQFIDDGIGTLEIIGRYERGILKISTPGLSKVNIDISYTNNLSENNNKSFPKAKRITLTPSELEAGLLEDILEQFIAEFKNEVNYDNT